MSVFRVRARGTGAKGTVPSQWLHTDGWCGNGDKGPQKVAEFPSAETARQAADSFEQDEAQEGLGPHREVVKVSWGLVYDVDVELGPECCPYYAGPHKGDNVKYLEDWTSSQKKAMRFDSAQAAQEYADRYLGYLRSDLEVIRFVKPTGT